MRFALLLIIAGFSVTCITATPAEEPELPPPPQSADAAKPEPIYPQRILMRCEHGCPSVPFITIRRPDIADTIDTADAEVGTNDQH